MNLKYFKNCDPIVFWFFPSRLFDCADCDWINRPPIYVKQWDLFVNWLYSLVYHQISNNINTTYVHGWLGFCIARRVSGLLSLRPSKYKRRRSYYIDEFIFRRWYDVISPLHRCCALHRIKFHSREKWNRNNSLEKQEKIIFFFFFSFYDDWLYYYVASCVGMQWKNIFSKNNNLKTAALYLPAELRWEISDVRRERDGNFFSVTKKR